MEQLGQTVSIALFAVAFVVMVFATLKRDVKDLKTLQAEAADQFKSWLASSGASQLGLKPGGCEIVLESETIGKDGEGVVYSYTLTLFLRSSDGKYIMFKSSPKMPYVKLVEHRVAKVVLKDKYVPTADG